jgi:hypothetical protein
MKTILRLSSYMAIALIVFSCSSTQKMAEPQKVILPLSDPHILREGSIVYGLPRTVLTFTVDFERTIEKPGPYARYASDLLGLDKVITEANEVWTIEGISVSSHQSFMLLKAILCSRPTCCL